MCEGSALGNWDPRKGQQPFRPKRGRRPHHHVVAAVYFLSCFFRLQWLPGHSFLPENDVANELARRGAPLLPSAIPSVSYPLFFFYRTGGVLSRLNSSTRMFPRFPLRNLCSLVFAATDTAYCQAFIFLGLTESRILHAAPADTRPKTPLISFYTVQLRTLRRSLFGERGLCRGSGPEELPGFWGSMVFHHALISSMESGRTTATCSSLR